MIKVSYLPRPVSYQVALSLCSGNALVPVHRAGPWNVKKGVQWLLSRLGGYQLRWHTLREKEVAKGPKSWAPSNSDLEEGVLYINSHAPDCDAQNEQTLWILINIKVDSGTPIAGWPEHKVRQMCQNKSKGMGGGYEYDRVPSQYLQPETVSAHGLVAAHLPTYAPVWHLTSGLSRCWEDSLCHYFRHGPWTIPRSSVW